MVTHTVSTERRWNSMRDADMSRDPALAPLLDRGHERALAGRAPVLVSRTEPADEIDPLDFFGRGAAVAVDRVFWGQPAERFALVGLGAADILCSDGVAGTDRFHGVAAAWRELLAAALIEAPDTGAPSHGPLLLGGFAFDPERASTGLWDGFPDALLILPRLMLTIHGDHRWLTYNAVLRPDSDPAVIAEELEGLRETAFRSLTPRPSPTAEERGDVREFSPLGRSTWLGEGQGVRAAFPWHRLVAEAAGTVRRGEMEKVVLARSVHVEANAAFDVPAALGRLRESYPTCTTFAVVRGGRVFLGASPERLVRVREGEVRVACLAGTIRRGETPADDRRLGAALLASAKDRTEHAIVVQSIREALADVCAEVRMPDRPSLLSVRNVHHLSTPVTARLALGATIFDLVDRLHPTPAVGGRPREAALRYIREHEGLDRGWYAAPVGWVGRDGGEFAVALRSALVEGNRATLFAGCGIVADSDPDAEYAESAIKLRPMLGALDVDRAGEAER